MSATTACASVLFTDMVHRDTDKISGFDFFALIYTIIINLLLCIPLM